MEENQNMNEEQLNQGGEQAAQQAAQQAQIDNIINKLNTPNPDPETQK